MPDIGEWWAVAIIVAALIYLSLPYRLSLFVFFFFFFGFFIIILNRKVRWWSLFNRA